MTCEASSLASAAASAEGDIAAGGVIGIISGASWLSLRFTAVTMPVRQLMLCDARCVRAAVPPRLAMLQRQQLFLMLTVQWILSTIQPELPPMGTVRQSPHWRLGWKHVMQGQL